MTKIPFPAEPYIPGRTPRPDEKIFEPLKADLTTALRAGLEYFETGYYWECHEMLEAVWMATSEPSHERRMAQAVIQLANARLKLRMGRPKAAGRLCEITRKLLDQIPESSRPFDQDIEYWRLQLAKTKAQLARDICP